MKKIPLTKGHFALVDDADYTFLMQWKWHAQVTKHTIYAVRKPWIAGSNGKSSKIYMHRVIARTPDEMLTDHIDGDGLNNRRSNLRWVTHQDNLFNRARWVKGCSSKYRGVYLDKRDGVWFSTITVNGKTTYIGRFKSEVEASKAFLLKKAELASGRFIRKGAI